jgi:hypothetical protein
LRLQALQFKPRRAASNRGQVPMTVRQSKLKLPYWFRLTRWRALQEQYGVTATVAEVVATETK